MFTMCVFAYEFMCVVLCCVACAFDDVFWPGAKVQMEEK